MNGSQALRLARFLCGEGTLKVSEAEALARELGYELQIRDDVSRDSELKVVRRELGYELHIRDKRFSG